MSVLTKRVAQLEAELGQEWRQYHVTAQLARFGSGFLATLLWSLHGGFTDWTDLVPLAGTAAWTAAAQVWPQVPWKFLLDRLHVGAPASGGAAAPASGSGGAPPPAAS